MNNKGQGILENIVSLLLAILLVFMIRSSVVEAFKIPSGSMIPTLLVGDHIFVNKFAYGFKIPFSDLVFDKAVDIVKREPPKRGDIIVFKFPKDESIYYIKRVIGVPGDVIEMKNKVLNINGKPVVREPLTGDRAERIFGDLDDPKYSRSALELYNERLDAGDHAVDHVIMLDKTNFLSESTSPLTVPAESLFVMGDNRDFSNDSRYWGFVPFRNVKGKAMIIWLSLAVDWNTGSFSSFFSDSHIEFRPRRFFNVLH